jgi:hypothetical protein
MRLDRHCSYGLHVQGWALTFERKRGCWPQWSVYRAGGAGSKRINNTLGHQRGDAVLKETAGRLRARVRASDTLARCGGDEFCIILSEVAREEDCARIVNNLRVAVAASTGDSYAITCSIGYALLSAGGRRQCHTCRPAHVRRQAGIALRAGPVCSYPGERAGYLNGRSTRGTLERFSPSGRGNSRPLIAVMGRVGLRYLLQNLSRHPD